MARRNLFQELAGLLMLALVLAAVFAIPRAHAADEDQFLNASRGIGSRLMSTAITPVTMVAGATTQASFTLPVGSYIRDVRLETGTAFTGSPTNINFSAGSTAGGADIVAATDVKAAGHIVASVVSAFDVTNAAAAGAYTVNYQIVAVGGTNPAGTVYVVLSYAAPVR